MGVPFNKTGILSASGMNINANLCINSTKDYNASHGSYAIADFNLSESLVANQKYTISAHINTSEEKKSVGFYLSGGSMVLVNWRPITEDGFYSGTFTATSTHASNTAGAGHGFIRVYVSNNTSAQGSTAVTGTANVDWIKLEIGETATPWTMNPLDYGYVDSAHGFIETGDLMRVYDGRIDTTEFIEY